MLFEHEVTVSGTARKESSSCMVEVVKWLSDMDVLCIWIFDLGESSRSIKTRCENS